ncbi:MAG: RIP metalloprotease RseP [Pyrinomonadaceae bacterium]
MTIIIAILAVIFVLGVAINIHEFGHFAVAKLLGMRVDAYSFFGLGPRVWGFKRGHTDYRISAIPLGAYVKLHGDEATAPLEGGLEEGEKVPESELYELRPRWQKFLVMIGGPFMNLMLALAIPFSLALIYGVPTTPSPIVASVKANGAAEQAGVKVGDRIVAFDGVENPSWDRVRNDSMIAPNMQIPMTVERNGQKVNLSIKPTKEDIKGNSVGNLDFEPTELVILSPVSGSPAEQAGIQRGDKAVSINGETIRGLDNFKELIQKYKENPIRLVVIRKNQPLEISLQTKINDDGKAIIGANLTNQSLDKVKASFGQALGYAWHTNIEILRLTGKAFGQVSKGERSAGDTFSGPIGIVQIISQIANNASFIDLLGVLGLISLNLGIFNLLPIPMLDGGQIMVLAIEGFLALFGLTLSMKIKEKIQLVGLAAILLLMVFTIFNDVAKFFR